MNNRNNLSRLTADIPKEHHIKLKSIAVLTGKSIREILINAIDSIKLEDLECASSDHIPNKETQKRFEDVKNKKNIKEAEDLVDLLKKLGLKC